MNPDTGPLPGARCCMVAIGGPRRRAVPVAGTERTPSPVGRSTARDQRAPPSKRRVARTPNSKNLGTATQFTNGENANPPQTESPCVSPLPIASSERQADHVLEPIQVRRLGI